MLFVAKNILRNDLRVHNLTIFHGVEHALDPYQMRVTHTLSTLCSCCPNVTCSAWVRHWESFLKSVRNGTRANSCAATGQSLNKFQVHHTYIHMKLAITHVNNWALTLINFPIFTQAPANLMWPQTQLFLGVAIPLNFVKLKNACTGLYMHLLCYCVHALICPTV